MAEHSSEASHPSLGKTMSDPIQNNYMRLVTDSDPQKIKDSLFQDGILDLDDMAEISAKQDHFGRKRAAEMLFLGLIDKAKRDKGFRVVNSLIEAFRLSGLDGMKDMAELLERSKTSKLTCEASKETVDGVEIVDGPRKRGQSDGETAPDNSQLFPPPPKQTCSRRDDAYLCGQRSTRKFTPDDFLKLEKSGAAISWEKIGSHLPDKTSGRDDVYALTDAELANIKKTKEGNIHECITATIKLWTKQSEQLHNVAELCKVLQKLKMGGVAENVFGSLG